MDIPDNTDENPYQSPEEPQPAIVEVVEEERRPWGFWATIGLSLVAAVAFVIAEVIVTIAFVVWVQITNPSMDLGQFAAEMTSNGFFLSVATIVKWIPCFALILLFVKLRRGWSLGEYLAVQRVSWRSLLLWLVILALFLIGTEVLGYCLGRPAIPEFMEDVYRTAGFPPLLWFAIIVVAPVFEELFFRGFMFRGIAASWVGNVGAILITSLLFAAIHVQYDLYNQTVILAVGILFGIARASTKSTTTTIALHSAMNLAATIQVTWYLN